MSFNNSAITYAMLVIPAFFALTVVIQGFIKIGKDEPEGPVALGFGVFLFLLIGAVYWLFIR